MALSRQLDCNGVDYAAYQIANTSEVDKEISIANSPCGTNGTDSINGRDRYQCVESSKTLVIEFSPSNHGSFRNEILNFKSVNITRGTEFEAKVNLNHLNFTVHLNIDLSVVETSFPCFLKLPLELQLKIWRTAAWQARVIGIEDLENKPRLSGNSARCALLMVCKQSRYEVMKVKKDLNKGSLSSAPKIFTNLAVDTLWLIFQRADVYDLKSGHLYNHITEGPSQSIRRLAVNYSLFKRRWDEMNAMVFKLDLNHLILVVEAEVIVWNDVAVFIPPRSEVGRRFNWKDWESVTRHEVRQLKDCLSHARYSYDRHIKNGITHEELRERGKRDMSQWKMPKIVLRDIVNSRNARNDELTTVAAEDENNDRAFDEDEDDISSEEESEYE